MCVTENLLVTCFATRAVHLDLTFLLSTTYFMNSFSYYLPVGDRKKSQAIIGQTLRGAKREIRELVQAINLERIAENAASKGIR